MLADEILELLGDLPSGLVIDATVGLGGHAEALLDAYPDHRLVGLDRDADTLALADLRLARWNGRYELVHADYRRLGSLIVERGWDRIAAIVADLGASSLQLDSAERGFSFRQEGPLDMRMDRSQRRTAADLVHRLSAEELERLVREHGEERYAGRIARAIVAARADEPILTTTRLADVVASAVPRRGQERIHPATRTFQALRIAVNDELSGLYDFVIEAARSLVPGGRLAVVAFHSLEDRPVKHAFRHLASDCECPPELPQCVCDKRTEVEILTPRPVRPSAAEIAENPRSRSARLRVLERLRSQEVGTGESGICGSTAS
ncbi:MAG: 16S rRNA (cytosine(1402)-N(4))-methyltransferase RsmH [Acidobacteriota bacterium]